MDSRLKGILYAGVCSAVVILSTGEISAFSDQGNGGLLFKPINTLLTSQITPLVLGGGAVGSVAFAAVQQSVMPLLYGGAAVLFYTGAKSLVGKVAGLML